MDKVDLTQHRIGILGFGQEGQAVLRYLNKHKLSATIYDEKPENEWLENALKEAQEMRAVIKTGENYLDEIAESTLLFRSPGIWRHHPGILAAEQRGSIITSQTKWFFENNVAQIIGVTGTKGKGTTCSLIYEVLKAAKKECYLTGNIGKTQPLDFLDEINENTLVVYELSSFQLQDLTVSPQIGICLMTTSDHLNHHKNLEEYHSAKAAIATFQNPDDICIYNADYPASEKIGQLGSGHKVSISALNNESAHLGAFISGDSIQLHLNNQNGSVNYSINCSNRKLRGAHNMENIAAAALVGLTLDIDLKIISTSVNNFPGLEHRLQLVKEAGGVSFYDDSISTVPDTTMAAVKSFTEPIHLLIGGSDKGLSYLGLIEFLKKQSNITSVTLLGEVGNKLKTLFSDVGNESSTITINGPFVNLEEALKTINANIKPGDIVLLSPAAASFDMFQNYAERGQKFTEIVNSFD